MATRKQERVSRVIKEVVIEAVSHHLNDPRIEGFVSVTRVELTPNLRSAEVYLSFFGNEKGYGKTFSAIKHARSRIQSLLAKKLKSKFCPVLRFHKDEDFKKAIETMHIIEQLSQERRETELKEKEQD